MKWKYDREQSKVVAKDLMRQRKVLQISHTHMGLQGVHFEDFVVKFDKMVYWCEPGQERVHAALITNFDILWDLIPIGKELMM